MLDTSMTQLRWALIVSLLAWAVFSPSSVYAITPTPATTELQLRGTVPPHVSDLSLALSSTTQGQTAGSDKTITYTVTYGSALPYSTPLTIEAEWSLGTIPGQNLSAFDVASYVPGSASSGHGGAVPTVDLVHRKITWIIDAFPANTQGSLVSFNLKTPSSALSTQRIDFSLVARLSLPRLTLPERELITSYLGTVATSSPTLSPSPSVTSAARERLRIIGVQIQELQSSRAAILVETNQASTTKISFGASLDVDRSITDLHFSQRKIIHLTDLESSTTHYFRVRAINGKGETADGPDLYTFTTPSTASSTGLDWQRALVRSTGAVVKQGLIEGQDQTVIFPINRHLDINLPFTGHPPPAQVSVQWVNATVLGINNIDPVPFLEKIRLIESVPGVFGGEILSPLSPGIYDLMLESQSLTGSYVRKKLGSFRIVKPMMVVSEKGEPIEHARAEFEIFDPATSTYYRFPAESFGSQNPTFSDPDGVLDTVLVAGRYLVKVTSYGFVPAEEALDFSPLKDTQYPTIILKKSPFSLSQDALRYIETAEYTARFFGFSLAQIFASARFSQLVYLVGLMVCSIFSLLLTAHHLKIRLEDMWTYLEKYSRIIRGHRIDAERLFVGFLETESGQAIHGAVVELTSGDDKLPRYKTLTNVWGEFRLSAALNKPYTLKIRKKGFETKTWGLLRDKQSPSHSRFILSQVAVTHRYPVGEVLAVVGMALLRMGSDVLLFALVVFHIAYIRQFGLMTDLSSSLLTGFNLVMWLELIWRDHKLSQTRQRAATNS